MRLIAARGGLNGGGMLVKKDIFLGWDMWEALNRAVRDEQY